MTGRAQRVAVMLGLSLGIVACAPNTAVSARVASALDTFAIVVDPAYGFAMDACIARETLIADNVEAGRTPLETGQRELTRVRTACATTRRAFDEIRTQHDAARRMYANGALTDAERALDRVRASWAGMKGDGE